MNTAWTWLWEEGEIQHQVSCSKDVRGYTLWIDDEQLYTCKSGTTIFYPRFIEDEFKLLNYSFRFIVYNYEPELFINGNSLTDQTKYETRKGSIQREIKKNSLFQILIGVVCVLVFLSSIFLFKEYSTYLFAPCFIGIIYIAVNIYRAFRSDCS